MAKLSIIPWKKSKKGKQLQYSETDADQLSFLDSRRRDFNATESDYKAQEAKLSTKKDSSSLKKVKSSSSSSSRSLKQGKQAVKLGKQTKQVKLTKSGKHSKPNKQKKDAKSVRFQLNQSPPNSYLQPPYQHPYHPYSLPFAPHTAYPPPHPHGGYSGYGTCSSYSCNPYHCAPFNQFNQCGPCHDDIHETCDSRDKSGKKRGKSLFIYGRSDNTVESSVTDPESGSWDINDGIKNGRNSGNGAIETMETIAHCIADSVFDTVEALQKVMPCDGAGCIATDNNKCKHETFYNGHNAEDDSEWEDVNENDIDNDEDPRDQRSAGAKNNKGNSVDATGKAGKGKTSCAMNAMKSAIKTSWTRSSTAKKKTMIKTDNDASFESVEHSTRKDHLDKNSKTIEACAVHKRVTSSSSSLTNLNALPKAAPTTDFPTASNSAPSGTFANASPASLVQSPSAVVAPSASTVVSSSPASFEVTASDAANVHSTDSTIDCASKIPSKFPTIKPPPSSTTPKQILPAASRTSPTSIMAFPFDEIENGKTNGEMSNNEFDAFDAFGLKSTNSSNAANGTNAQVVDTTAQAGIQAYAQAGAVATPESNPESKHSNQNKNLASTLPSNSTIGLNSFTNLPSSSFNLFVSDYFNSLKGTSDANNNDTFASFVDALQTSFHGDISEILNAPANRGLIASIFANPDASFDAVNSSLANIVNANPRPLTDADGSLDTLAKLYSTFKEFGASNSIQDKIKENESGEDDSPKVEPGGATMETAGESASATPKAKIKTGTKSSAISYSTTSRKEDSKRDASAALKGTRKAISAASVSSVAAESNVASKENPSTRDTPASNVAAKGPKITMSDIPSKGIANIELECTMGQVQHGKTVLDGRYQQQRLPPSRPSARSSDSLSSKFSQISDESPGHVPVETVHVNEHNKSFVSILAGDNGCFSSVRPSRRNENNDLVEVMDTYNITLCGVKLLNFDVCTTEYSPDDGDDEEDMDEEEYDEYTVDNQRKSHAGSVRSVRMGRSSVRCSSVGRRSLGGMRQSSKVHVMEDAIHETIDSTIDDEISAMDKFTPMVAEEVDKIVAEANESALGDCGEYSYLTYEEDAKHSKSKKSATRSVSSKKKNEDRKINNAKQATLESEESQDMEISDYESFAISNNIVNNIPQGEDGNDHGHSRSENGSVSKKLFLPEYDRHSLGNDSDVSDCRDAVGSYEVDVSATAIECSFDVAGAEAGVGVRVRKGGEREISKKASTESKSHIEEAKYCGCCGAVSGVAGAVGSKRKIKLKICSNCRSVHYCSSKCQKQHWQDGHKIQCKMIDAANTLS